MLVPETSFKRGSSSMNQRFRPALEQHLDLGSMFHSRCNATAEHGVFQDVTRFIPVLGRIGLRDRCIVCPQKRLISIRRRFRRLGCLLITPVALSGPLR